MDGLDYRGKRVVITGAASGMGEATARLLGELGATVYALDIKPVRVPVEEYIETNLGDCASIDAARRRLRAPINALFGCAGVPGPPLSNLETMLVNFVGPRHLTEALVPLMPAGSAIVSISSVAGMGWKENLAAVRELLATASFAEARAWCQAHPEIANGYPFAKQCLIAYTLMQAKQLGPKGIRINCTSPGITETPMLPHFHALVTREWMETYLQGFLGRNARAEEQAWPLVFLNSAAASFVTGANLLVDGGYTGALATGEIAPPPPPPSPLPKVKP